MTEHRNSASFDTPPRTNTATSVNTNLTIT
jgi:hypothetical protein